MPFPKLKPSNFPSRTLGDIESQRDRGRVGYLYAFCNRGPCHRPHVPIDLDALIARFGRHHQVSELKAVCRHCKEAGLTWHGSTIRVHWTGQSHVTGQHPGSKMPVQPDMRGHNNPPPDKPKIWKKRRRKKSGFETQKKAPGRSQGQI